MLKKASLYSARAVRGIAVGGVILISSSAFAGGFSRGEADTDILYGDADFGMRAGAVFASPGRSYATMMGNATSDDAYSDSFWIPSVGIKAKLGENLSCALTYTRSFGASATYGNAAQNAELITAIALGLPLANPTSRMEFSSDEYGATCDVHFDTGPGNLHLIGGVFLETFEYKEDTWFGSVDLKDNGSLGYRMGVAYDIPDYALRVQAMYRSEVEHDADGLFYPSALAVAQGVTMNLPTAGTGTLPQSFKLYVQSGVAPGWLAYGSVTWTDWSVLQTFSYDVSNLATSNKIFNYKDGYTVQMGVGHQFSDTLSGTINLTWDEGVGTKADIATDTWTLGVGGEYKTKYGTFGLGTAVSYLTSGSQTVADGATYDATADGDWAVAIGMTYAIEF